MKNFTTPYLLRRLALLPVLLLVFASAVSAQDKKFFGEWVSVSSTVHYAISQEGGKCQVTALDESDGEELVVSEVRVVSPKVISFHLYTPSTNWNVDIEFTLAGKGVINEVVSGDGNAEYNYYLRGSKAHKKALKSVE
jgi:hypothetical protein